jgi:hypothetical protein
MSSDNIYMGISHVVHISTNIEKPCEHCHFHLKSDKFAESINHYIEQHGYKLLHIGTETVQDYEGKLCHTSVAILGK